MLSHEESICWELKLKLWYLLIGSFESGSFHNYKYRCLVFSTNDKKVTYFNNISGWGTKAWGSNYFRWGVRALVVRWTSGLSVDHRGSCSRFTEPRRERTTSAASRLRQDPPTSGQKVNPQKLVWNKNAFQLEADLAISHYPRCMSGGYNEVQPEHV